MALALALFGCGGHTRGNAPGSGAEGTEPETNEPETNVPATPEPDPDPEPEPSPLVKVSMSDSSACTLRSDGRVACFDLNHGFDSASAPVSGTFRDIAGDASKGAALREDGSVVTWGDAVPQFPKGRLEHIAFDELSACGIRDDHAIVCDGTAVQQLALLMGNYQQLLVAGDGGVCGLTTDGTLNCHGISASANLPPLREVSVDPVGMMGGCGIDLTGHLHCWDYYCPIPGTFSHVSLSYFDACAITTEGQLQCWNYRLTRDDCNSPPSAIELPTPPTGTFSQLASGIIKTCAIEARGENVRCW